MGGKTYPGRAGSWLRWFAGGHALGITDLDPLQYDLLFERFLNPERVSMPDFDVDFVWKGAIVIQHVSDLYGAEAVSQPLLGTMAAKAVARDVARTRQTLWFGRQAVEVDP